MYAGSKIDPAEGFFMSSIQNTIADIRKKHNLTQDGFAEKLFVTRQAVSRWENGETTPTIDTLKTIAELFGVDANTLLGLAETPVCQSCAMPLQGLEDFGSNADGSANTDYCAHCFKGGGFTHNRSVEEQVRSNLRFLDAFNQTNGTNYTEAEALDVLTAHLKTLKRWKRQGAGNYAHSE
jgi:transcriptional regulator with XRE-family HTH domain